MNDPQYGWWLPPDVSLNGGDLLCKRLRFGKMLLV